MRTSESIKEIMPALLEAQKSIQNVKATKTNPFADYTYADLADVLNTVRPSLNENGIIVVQGITSNGEIVVTTRLQHTSGEYIETDFAVPPVQNKKSNPVQAMGAGITYARRYSLSALCGISSEEDSDGAGLTEKPLTQEKPQPPNGNGSPKGTPPPPKKSKRQEVIDEVGELIKGCSALPEKEIAMYKKHLKDAGNNEAKLQEVLEDVRKAVKYRNQDTPVSPEKEAEVEAKIVNEQPQEEAEINDQEALDIF